VFHAPQQAHCPAHLGWFVPQSRQMYSTFMRAMRRA
jgi:hypothetical protein